MPGTVLGSNLAELDSLLAALDRGVETETETEPDYGDYSSRARELDYDYSRDHAYHWIFSRKLD